MTTRSELLKKQYGLQKHPEGGWFSELYTAPFVQNGRPIAGSIYFLLDAGEISHFHQIDCDEIWYFHEGCGMTITVLSEQGMQKLLLGNDAENGESPMAVIPKGAVFAAENRNVDGYSFVSCATAPKFDYKGFRLVNLDEIRKTHPEFEKRVGYLAYR